MKESKFCLACISSHQRCSVRKGGLRNFTKFTGKHLHQSLFFNKTAGLRPATLLKKSLWHRCSPVNSANFLTTPFSQNTSGRLLLDMAWIGAKISRSKNMGFSTQWNKRIAISHCIKIQNQKMYPWSMSTQNMQNLSWASRVYNKIKYLTLFTRALSFPPDIYSNYLLLLIILFSFTEWL